MLTVTFSKNIPIFSNPHSITTSKFGSFVIKNYFRFLTSQRLDLYAIAINIYYLKQMFNCQIIMIVRR